MDGVVIGVMRNDFGKVMTMVKSNPFKGVNKVCAQCVRDCKQFENVILVNCPKFQSIRTDTPLSSRRTKSAVVQNKGHKSTKQYQSSFGGRNVR
jgi:hypothetical protein